MATDLIDAAGRSYDNLFVKWQLNLLGNSMATFNLQVSNTFNDNVANDRPVGNFCILMRALISEWPAGAFQPDLNKLDECANLVYRVCWATNQMFVQSLITLAQYNAVLAAYNGAIE